MENLNPNQSLPIQENSSAVFPFYRTEILKNLPNMLPDELNSCFNKNFDLLKPSIKAQLQSSKPVSKEEILGFIKSVLSIRSDSNEKELFTRVASKKKAIILCLVSIYEAVSKKGLQDFEYKDWQKISFFFPKLDGYKLKYKWFVCTENSYSNKVWTLEQDNALRKAMGIFYPNLLQSSREEAAPTKIKWSKISFEMSKELASFSNIKTSMQCKERWLNHINPFLKKELWPLEDDVKLMNESMKFPAKWAKISRVFPGRTQHQIKNRFIGLVNRELRMKREKIRELIKEKASHGALKDAIAQTLKVLNLKNENLMQRLKKEERESQANKQVKIEENKNEIAETTDRSLNQTDNNNPPAATIKQENGENEQNPEFVQLQMKLAIYFRLCSEYFFLYNLLFRNPGEST